MVKKKLGLPNNDECRDLFQSKLLTNGGKDNAFAVWHYTKASQKSLHSWYRLLRDWCEIEYCVLKPDKNHSLYLVNESGENVPLYLPLDPGVGLKVLISKEYDAQNIDFFSTLTKVYPGGKWVIVDIGANIGMFTRQCLGHHENLVDSIYSYEPDPTIFSLLEMNCPHRKVSSFMAALGDNTGTTKLWVDEKHPSSSSLLRSSLPDEFYSSKSKTIDIMDAKLESIKWTSSSNYLFYKSDTQGYDEQIAIRLGNEFFEGCTGAVLEIFPGEKSYKIEEFMDAIRSFTHKSTMHERTVCLSDDDLVHMIKAGKGFDLALWR